MADNETTPAASESVAAQLSPDEANKLLNDDTDGSKVEVSFSQADVDKMIADRLKRERDKYKDYRDLQVKAAEFDKVAEAKKTAEERALEQAQQAQARADQLLQRAVRSEIKALASEKFADPDDPGGFLDATRYINGDGDVDTDAIRADLDDLLARKPHLGKPDPGPRNPAPNRAQGTSGNGRVEAPVSPGLDRLRYAYGTTATK